MKLWQKDNTKVSQIIEQFTVGNDRAFDLLLAKHDVQGSLAHVAMLQKVNLLSLEDHAAIQKGLEEIISEIESGTFFIDETSEDIHSQIELMLTERIGDAGKKIHSGRSRNDQIAVDIKLYLRDELLQIKNIVTELFTLLLQQSEAHKDKLLPGYTHLQIAMPSSFGLWFGAYAESLVDDMELLATAYHMANKNPLGSGAGYGSSFPLDRSMTTELLQFEELHYNSVYAQMSRGKTERFVAMAMSSIAATLSRLSMDICLYMNQNFGFISFPDVLTTGSSIMPHKKNPDVAELIRGKCNRIQSIPNELTLLINNLPSGYHRDMQLTKEILFPAITELKTCIGMMILMLQNIVVKDDILKEERYKYVFTVEEVNRLVNEGVPFRDAYRQVGEAVENGTFEYKLTDLHHTHEGSIGNLCNDKIKTMMDKALARIVM
ncbi:MAG: argininosuccinate lyase [Taibaiella sp.]|nr:argininosuccinate lyase [Taibaiella sp.]